MGLSFQRNHILETRPRRDRDRRRRNTRILIADVLDEQQHQHIILILRCIHPAAQFVAALPEGGVEFRFFDWHVPDYKTKSHFERNSVIATSLKRRGCSPRRHLHQHVIFELLGNSWQIMQVSNPLVTGDCFVAPRRHSQ